MKLANEVISIDVLLFARLAELAGSKRISLTIPKGLRIQELQEQLVCRHPELEQLIAASRWAVSAEFVESDFLVEEAASIALIPPVSGG